jgi:parallel beta-helix repeat protein
MHLSPSYQDRASCLESVIQRQKLFLLIGASALIVLGRDPAALAQPLLTAQVAQRLPAQQLWVNPQTGNDSGDGSEQAPLRTLTRALQLSRANTVIQLAAGIYSRDSGEVFPIELRSGVTVQGNRDELGQSVVIRGGGSYQSPSMGNQNVTLIGVDQATLTGVTVTNPNPNGQGLWVEIGNPTVQDNLFMSSLNSGIVVAGSSAPLVQNNLFLLNRAGGLTVAGSAQPTVQGNTFQRTGSGLTIGDNAMPQIINNRISQNRDGIVVQGNAQPLLRNNRIEDSQQDGVVVIAQARPNLGTVNDPGNNVFLNSGQHDINALTSSQVLPAFGNQVASSVAGKIDFSGNAPLVGVTTVASVADHLPLAQSSRVSVLPPRPASLITQLPLIASLPPNSENLSATSADSATVNSTASSSASSSNTVSSNAASSSIVSPNTASSAGSEPVPQLPGSTPVAATSAQPVLAQSVSAQPVQLSSRPAVLNAVVIPVLAASAQRSASRPAVQINGPRPDTPSSFGSAAANRSTRAVEIPVSPPDGSTNSAQPVQPASVTVASVTVASAASLPRRDATIAVSAPKIGGTPIQIPVPPPEQRQATASITNTGSASLASSSASTMALLPVPAGTIPVGNTGKMPRINIAGLQGGAVSSQSLQYRVVVMATDQQTETLVRSVAPDAFVTTIKGQSMFQIGAFSTRENAQDAVDLLSRNGLTGIIQSIE